MNSDKEEKEKNGNKFIFDSVKVHKIGGSYMASIPKEFVEKHQLAGKELKLHVLANGLVILCPDDAKKLDKAWKIIKEDETGTTKAKAKSITEDKEKGGTGAQTKIDTTT